MSQDETGDPWFPRRVGAPVLLAGFGLVLGAVLRFWTIGSVSLYGDELQTLRWIQKPLAEILTNYGPGHTMHLYFVLMKGWCALAGTGAIAAKLPSLVAACLLLPVCFLVLRRWLNPEVAAVAVLLLAVNVPLVFRARHARVYALFTVVAVLVWVVFLRALRRGGAGHLALLAVANALLVALSLNGVPLVIAQGAVAGYEVVRGRLRPRPAIALLGSYAAFAGMGYAFYHRVLPGIRSMQSSLGAETIRPGLLYGTFTRNHATFLFPGPWTHWILATVVGIVLVGAARALARHGLPGRALVAWALVPSLFYLLQPMRLGDGHLSRFLTASIPAQIALLALGLLHLVQWPLARRARNPRYAAMWISAAIVLTCAVSSPSLRRTVARDNVPPTRQAMERLQELVQPGDVVTTEFEPYGILIEAVPDARYVSFGHPGQLAALDGGGRLIVITELRESGLRPWSESFEVERIDHPATSKSLLLLVSPPRVGPGGFREPVVSFLSGLLLALDSGDQALHVYPPAHEHHRQRLRRACEALAPEGEADRCAPAAAVEEHLP